MIGIIFAEVTLEVHNEGRPVHTAGVVEFAKVPTSRSFPLQQYALRLEKKALEIGKIVKPPCLALYSPTSALATCSMHISFDTWLRSEHASTLRVASLGAPGTA